MGGAGEHLGYTSMMHVYCLSFTITVFKIKHHLLYFMNLFFFRNSMGWGEILKDGIAHKSAKYFNLMGGQETGFSHEPLLTLINSARQYLLCFAFPHTPRVRLNNQ